MHDWRLEDPPLFLMNAALKQIHFPVNLVLKILRTYSNGRSSKGMIAPHAAGNFLRGKTKCYPILIRTCKTENCANFI